jgi:hypothetical protein
MCRTAIFSVAVDCGLERSCEGVMMRVLDRGGKVQKMLLWCGFCVAFENAESLMRESRVCGGRETFSRGDSE